MTTSFKNQISNEQGNALFLILIAVALFAALSYAVTQSGRGSGGVDREQSIISAAQVTQFPSTVRTGVTRMVLTGIPVTNLDFTSSPSPTDETHVFGAAGGGVIIQAPPPGIDAGVESVAVNDWVYLDAPGSRATGHFVNNLGTNLGAGGREVLMALSDIREAVCAQINRGLGASGTIPVDATAVTLSGNGVANAGANAGTFDGTGIDAVPFNCVRNGAEGPYVYYHAIVEQ